ncbi:MAG: tRNA pseudouridine(38-40) synthase TruA [Planctomycetes bacterium]|nr:tRNA pseudouridine(38-40) synthase TruA [Planctomycetota bacterium]
MRIKAHLSYHGSSFVGWQIQAQGKTVQGEMEKAVQLFSGQATKVFGAGRTDAGVHAKDQVCHFDLSSPCDFRRLKRALNGITPENIAVHHLEEVDESFHARFSAHQKTYTYSYDYSDPADIFQRETHYHVKNRELNFELMSKFMLLIKGTHDFSSFCSSQNDTQSTTRTLVGAKIEHIPEESKFYLSVEGKGFLQHMVRIIAGANLALATGKITLDHIQQALASPQQRALLGPTLPAHGLCLMKTQYISES